MKRAKPGSSTTFTISCLAFATHAGMSVREPASLEMTSMTSPTCPIRMAPMRFSSGPGQAIPRASIDFVGANSVSVMSFLHLDESDRAGRGVVHEGGNAFDVVHERV